MPTSGNSLLPAAPGGKETLEQIYRRGRALLAAAPGAGDNTPMEAAFLFQKVFGLSRGDLLARGGESPSPEKTAAFEELLRRRLAGEPLQYLLGEWEFFGLPFLVGPGVLIPRPETELLVETALDLIDGVPSPALLDLCSGSGCIPIALGSSRPDAQVWGVELSPQAFSYFEQNLSLNRTGNVTAVAGDIFFLPPEVTRRKYRLITANPPYIPRDDLPRLQREVLAEPSMALDGGVDGLDFYRRLPSLCAPLLEPGGALLLEIGEDQGRAVSALLAEAGYQKVQVLQDLSGLDRVVFGFF
jgi:release factor glutamine methyltransferase